MTKYYQPLLQSHAARTAGAATLGWTWFDQVLVHQRGVEPTLAPATVVPEPVMSAMTSPREPVAGLTMDQPRVMGILNVTPDSFSDGGQFNAPDAALGRALQMVADGADILDIGGESTRPGAKAVDITEEIDRTAPVIAAIRAGSDVAVSIDTRKSQVASAALEAGANLVNDVAAMCYDPALASVVAACDAPVCLMHAQGDPETMQEAPSYQNVLLDVYDFLAQRIETAVAAGISKDRIVVDPGIGFGKTLEHNLTLIRGLSLFHGLGCPILLGASRKRFIGTLGNAPDAADRVAGSIAVALKGAASGVQFLRVHDTFETKQALTLQKEMG